jgi:hypothetical protein
MDSSTIVINKQSTKQLVKNFTNVYPPPKELKECPCNEPFFNLKAIDTNFKITKDILNPANWTKVLVRGKFTKSADYTNCVFEITNADFK